MVAVLAALTLSGAAGVPVTCVNDGAWTQSFPAEIRAARGVYDTVNRTIAIRTAECARLQLLMRGAEPRNEHYQYSFANAVFLFGHEVAHSRGIDDERAADCAAGRGFFRTTTALGISRGFAHVLADYLVNANLPKDCYPRG